MLYSFTKHCGQNGLLKLCNQSDQFNVPSGLSCHFQINANRAKQTTFVSSRFIFTAVSAQWMGFLKANCEYLFLSFVSQLPAEFGKWIMPYAEHWCWWQPTYDFSLNPNRKHDAIPALPVSHDGGCATMIDKHDLIYEIIAMKNGFLVDGGMKWLAVMKIEFLKTESKNNARKLLWTLWRRKRHLAHIARDFFPYLFSIWISSSAYRNCWPHCCINWYGVRLCKVSASLKWT